MIFRAAAIAIAIVSAGAAPAPAPDVPAPPEHTQPRPRVQVPPELASQGVAYFAIPTREHQAAFTSDAPLERFVGVTRAIHGYAVLDAHTAIIGAHFRLPVDTLDTGIPLRDEHLRSERWLDADTHPDITLAVVESRNPQRVAVTTEYVTHSMELVCDVTVRGVTRELRIPATLTRIHENPRTRALARGDLLAIRCAFPLRLSDFAIGTGDPLLRAGKLADEIAIDVRLFLSSYQE